MLCCVLDLGQDVIVRVADAAWRGSDTPTQVFRRRNGCAEAALRPAAEGPRRPDDGIGTANQIQEIAECLT